MLYNAEGINLQLTRPYNNHDIIRQSPCGSEFTKPLFSAEIIGFQDVLKRSHWLTC